MPIPSATAFLAAAALATAVSTAPAQERQVTETPPSSTPGNEWAAVVADGNGRFGLALGMPSEAAARALAVKGCGSAECRMVFVGQAKCVAIFESRVGGYWFGVGLGQRRLHVVNTARQGCQRRAPWATCKRVQLRCR